MERRQGRRARVIAIVIAAWLAHDLLVPPRYAIDAKAAAFAIERYQANISPHLHGVVECRFTPTCSHYGHDAIVKDGLLVGGARTAWRIARCGPWTPAGTYDPP